MKKKSPSAASKTKELKLGSYEWHPFLTLLLMLLLAIFLPYLFSAASALGRRWKADNVDSNPCNKTFAMTNFHGNHNGSYNVTVFGEWHTIGDATNVIGCITQLHPPGAPLHVLLEGSSSKAGEKYPCGKLRPEYKKLGLNNNIQCFSIEGPPTPESQEHHKLELSMAFNGLSPDDPGMVAMTKRREELRQARFDNVDAGLFATAKKVHRMDPGVPVIAIVGINHANPAKSPKFFSEPKNMRLFTTKTPDPNTHIGTPPL
jgi:hypothetical protein